MSQLSSRLELTRPHRGGHHFEWLEIILAVLAVPMVGALLTPHDPFFNEASFPWGALAPLVISLRHGSAKGLITAAALTGLNALTVDSIWMQDATFSREIALGYFLIALIGGVWSDSYRHRLDAELVRADYQSQRLDDFAQNYHALRISHDRLEYRLAGSVVSLRETLQDVRRAFRQSVEGGSHLEDYADDILALFDSFSWVQAADLYIVDDAGRVLASPAAEVGDPKPLDGTNPLVEAALRTRKLVNLSELDPAHQIGTVLVAAPLVDGTNRVRALVTVRRIPFLSFTPDNIQLLAVLSAHVGHLISEAELAGKGDSEQRFRRELQRVCRDAETFHLPAMLVRVLLTSPDHQHALANYIMSLLRGLDVATKKQVGPQTELMLLMPLTEAREYETFQNRIEESVEQRFGRSLTALGCSISKRPIGPDSNADAIWTSWRGPHG
ncbi:MAG: PelD GGDEF domain-containing protein [Pseudomonadota bacterium]